MIRNPAEELSSGECSDRYPINSEAVRRKVEETIGAKFLNDSSILNDQVAGFDLTRKFSKESITGHDMVVNRAIATGEDLVAVHESYEPFLSADPNKSDQPQPYFYPFTKKQVDLAQYRPVKGYGLQGRTPSGRTIFVFCREYYVPDHLQKNPRHPGKTLTIAIDGISIVTMDGISTVQDLPEEKQTAISEGLREHIVELFELH